MSISNKAVESEAVESLGSFKVCKLGKLWKAMEGEAWKAWKAMEGKAWKASSCGSFGR